MEFIHNYLLIGNFFKFSNILWQLGVVRRNNFEYDLNFLQFITCFLQLIFIIKILEKILQIYHKVNIAFCYYIIIIILLSYYYYNINGFIKENNRICLLKAFSKIDNCYIK